VAKGNIANTLIDISHESKLNHAEKVSLRLVAKKVKELLAENKRLKKLLREIKEEPLAAMKIRSTLKKGDKK